MSAVAAAIQSPYTGIYAADTTLTSPVGYIVGVNGGYAIDTALGSGLSLYINGGIVYIEIPDSLRASVVGGGYY